MTIKINGEYFILWRAVDSKGYELDVFLQKRRNKKSAIRFLSRLLQSYPVPRVIITDKLKSYIKPIKEMCRLTKHRNHKRLNQPTPSPWKMSIKADQAASNQLQAIVAMLRRRLASHGCTQQERTVESSIIHV